MFSIAFVSKRFANLYIFIYIFYTASQLYWGPGCTYVIFICRSYFLPSNQLNIYEGTGRVDKYRNCKPLQHIQLALVYPNCIAEYRQIKRKLQYNCSKSVCERQIKSQWTHICNVHTGHDLFLLTEEYRCSVYCVYSCRRTSFLHGMWVTDKKKYACR